MSTTQRNKEKGTVRIAVLSDTHMMSPSQTLARCFDTHFQDMDAVLHCGDITGEQVYMFLNSHSRFYAVAGNMDAGQWADNLPRKTTVKVDGIRIGLVHGFGFGSGSVAQKVASSFAEESVDLACFGHTHKRLFDPDSYAVPVLNPGSFSLPKGGAAGFACVHFRPGREINVEWVDV